MQRRDICCSLRHYQPSLLHHCQETHLSRNRHLVEREDSEQSSILSQAQEQRFCQRSFSSSSFEHLCIVHSAT